MITDADIAADVRLREESLRYLRRFSSDSVFSSNFLRSVWGRMAMGRPLTDKQHAAVINIARKERRP